MSKETKEIPIFFAIDDNYIKFLTVTIKSLIANSSKENNYALKILYTNVSNERKEKIKKFERENVSIEFIDVTKYIEKIQEKLYTRDYFSNTTYYRLFLPDLCPQYDKVIYIDSDTVLLKDIANLYNIELEDNLVAGVPDEAVQTIPVFSEYVEKVVGMAHASNYFNAGVLVMNLKELRKFKFQEKFLYLLDNIIFSVAQDQDYLNRLCKGRVKLLDKSWNKEPISGKDMDVKDINLIHYNLAFKPWHIDGIPYEEIFWKYAKETEYYDEMIKIKAAYGEEEKQRDEECNINLQKLARKECDCVGDDRYLRGDK